MRKRIFIYQYNLDVGGIERSLIGLLNSLDYSKYEVDLFLVKHEGAFMEMIPKEVNLLKEEKVFFNMGVPIRDLFTKRKYTIGFVRLWGRIRAFIREKVFRKKTSSEFISQIVYPQIVKMLPKQKKQYDLALSFYWPHYYTISKVDARVKVAWIHTDYSKIYPDLKKDKKMWQMYDYIACVSEDCKREFDKLFQDLTNKTIVIENILLSDFVRNRQRGRCIFRDK